MTVYCSVFKIVIAYNTRMIMEFPWYTHITSTYMLSAQCFSTHTTTKSITAIMTNNRGATLGRIFHYSDFPTIFSIFNQQSIKVSNEHYFAYGRQMSHAIQVNSNYPICVENDMENSEMSTRCPITAPNTINTSFWGDESFKNIFLESQATLPII